MDQMYIVGTLPRLEFDAKPDTTTNSIFELFEMNLSTSSLAQVKVLRRWFDLQNIFRLIQNEEIFDLKGNYLKSTLKELMTSEEELPHYVFEFFEEYPDDEDRKKNFSKLIARYFEVEKKRALNPLKSFLQFENEWRVVIAGYKAKHVQADLGKLLVYEDFSDPIVQMTLAQKDAPGPYIFPFEYEHLETLIKDAGPNPTKQMKALAKYRFDYYAEIENEFPFSLRRLLAYLMQLFQLEEIFALDEVKGKQQLQNLMESENAS